MKRYLGIGLTALLVTAALLLPQGWFALKDASILENMHRESLDPLTVTQLDRSYERDIFTRMSTCLEASVAGNVIYSQKEIDPGNESLWENIGQAQESILMMVLQEAEYLLFDSQTVIESCTQYALIRESDSQILLVANDIHMVKEDGCHLELLIDGVDGTIYYIESEELLGIPKWMVWDDYQAVEWYYMLSDNYRSEPFLITEDTNDYWQAEQNTAVYDASGIDRVEVWEGITEFLNPYIRISREEDKQSYCCLLAFGALSDSWSMEWEEVEGEEFSSRIRMGLHMVIQNIPKLAERAAFVGYWNFIDPESMEQNQEKNYGKDTIP